MTRRMTLLVLALVGLMVLVVTVAPPRTTPQSRNGATATPQASAAPLLSDPGAFDVKATLKADPGTRPQLVEAELGDRVQILVEGDSPDSVALGDLGIEELESGVPARFELLAETPGDYPIVLLNENERIGTLKVR